MNHNKRVRTPSHPGLWLVHQHDNHAAISTTREESLTPQPSANGPERQPLLHSAFNPAHFLASLSQLPECEHQWVTIIGKPPQAALQQLIAAGISLSRIRCIPTTEPETACWATEQALLLNNSQVVLAWLGPVAGRERQRLQLAANASQAISFLYTDTSDQTSLH